MITISYTAMGILIAAINGVLLMAIILFLILYLKTHKDTSSIKQWVDKVSNKNAARVDELKKLLAIGLQLDEDKKSEVVKALSEKETELYTLIAETYVNRDNPELLSLDDKVEALFNVYIEAVTTHVTVENNLAEENKQILQSLQTIFQKYMLATDTELDASQEYSVTQMLEFVENNDINKENVRDNTDIQELEPIIDNQTEYQSLEEVPEKLGNEEPQVVEQIEVQHQLEDNADSETQSELSPELSAAPADIKNSNDNNLDQNMNE